MFGSKNCFPFEKLDNFVLSSCKAPGANSLEFVNHPAPFQSPGSKLSDPEGMYILVRKPTNWNKVCYNLVFILYLQIMGIVLLLNNNFGHNCFLECSEHMDHLYAKKNNHRWSSFNHN